MTTLFVNACMRGGKSRTLQLCQEYLDGMPGVHEVSLERLKLAPLDERSQAYRSQLVAAGVFDDDVFDLAHEFAEADDVVIGAPFWDRSFPAALKTYIEHVSVCDITFHFTKQAEYVGLCRAKTLTYITTSGGYLKGQNFGYEYVCAIAEMFGIDEVRMVAAEGLDVVGVDVNERIERAREQIAELKRADAERASE